MGTGSSQFIPVIEPRLLSPPDLAWACTNSLACHLGFVDEVCRGLSFVTTYVDDILVHSTTLQQHRLHLREIFQRLRAAGLTLCGNKCRLGMSKVVYLGHIFSDQGMAPDDQKVAAVRDWSTPSNVGDLRSFLGLASYYRRYVHNFAVIAAPLHQLTEKGTPFHWDAHCQQAFDSLKMALTQAPILAFPKFRSSAPPFACKLMLVQLESVQF